MCKSGIYGENVSLCCFTVQVPLGWQLGLAVRLGLLLLRLRTGTPRISFSPPGAARLSAVLVCSQLAGPFHGIVCNRSPMGGNCGINLRSVFGKWGKGATSRCSGQAPS